MGPTQPPNAPWQVGDTQSSAVETQANSIQARDGTGLDSVGQPPGAELVPQRVNTLFRDGGVARDIVSVVNVRRQYDAIVGEVRRRPVVAQDALFGDLPRHATPDLGGQHTLGGDVVAEVKRPRPPHKERRQARVQGVVGSNCAATAEIRIMHLIYVELPSVDNDIEGEQICKFCPTE